MSQRKTLGGDRLGSGKKMDVELHNYSRSTHDLGYIWRSTTAAGTLVPFLTELALPGDSFDIDLDAVVLTHPTIGPLFGSYKVQLDVFTAPIRLYQGQLHNNKLKIGLDMSKVKLPQIYMTAANPLYEGLDITDEDIDNLQINPSSIWSYLNIRGLGVGAVSYQKVDRMFNAVPYLAYWDIYKNYYANKQEEIGAVIHTDLTTFTRANVHDVIAYVGDTAPSIPYIDDEPLAGIRFRDINSLTILLKGEGAEDVTEDQIRSMVLWFQDGLRFSQTLGFCYNTFTKVSNTGWRIEDRYIAPGLERAYVLNWAMPSGVQPIEVSPRVHTFPLDNIDEMRENILTSVKDPNAFRITETSLEPYSLALKSLQSDPQGAIEYSKMYSQEGLALKTYQSDLFNNWLSTEWIDGDNGINAITAIDTSEGSFNIDTLNLSKKVYDMLNRIAVSGGSYEDWIDAVYQETRGWRAESPMYMGGLSKELVFQEVISNSEAISTEEGVQPLGTLAGRGVLSKKHKGGKIRVKVDEPSYIMGIFSLTPRIDYSQGNKWDVNLKTLDDLHKPALDQIGFQDLITDQMAWFDTPISIDNQPIYRSAGKQPAWINYMTNVNQVRGNFADAKGAGQMFMTLNRRYEAEMVGEEIKIKDLTTYIDPVKFNHIFADTRLDAQNFWVQIGVDITARRLMSAKVMPNL